MGRKSAVCCKKTHTNLKKNSTNSENSEQTLLTQPQTQVGGSSPRLNLSDFSELKAALFLCFFESSRVVFYVLLFLSVCVFS